MNDLHVNASHWHEKFVYLKLRKIRPAYASGISSNVVDSLHLSLDSTVNIDWL
jgi:hypothetical protein